MAAYRGNEEEAEEEADPGPKRIFAGAEMFRLEKTERICVQSSDCGRPREKEALGSSKGQNWPSELKSLREISFSSTEDETCSHLTDGKQQLAASIAPGG